jgi:hypothetical protein
MAKVIRFLSMIKQKKKNLDTLPLLVEAVPAAATSRFLWLDRARKRTAGNEVRLVRLEWIERG